jgi:hypothetical protein
MPVRKSYLLRFLSFSLVAIIIFFFILWGKVRDGNFFLRQAQQAVLSSLETSLSGAVSADRVSGNPITGFFFHGLSVRSAENSTLFLLSADQVRVYPSLTSLLLLSPKADKIKIDGLDADIDAIRATRPGGSSEIRPFTPPVDVLRLEGAQLRYSSEGTLHRVRLSDATLRFDALSRGTPSAASGDAAPAATTIRLRAKGDWDSVPFASEGLVRLVPDQLSLEGFALDLRDAELRIEGPAYPRTRLAGSLKAGDLQEIARLAYPPVAPHLRGRLDSTVLVEGEPRSLPRLSGTGGLLEASFWGYQIPRASGTWSLNLQEGRVFARVSEGGLFDAGLRGQILYAWSPGAALSLDVTLRNGSLRPFRPLLAALADLDGSFREVRLRLAGSPSAPLGTIRFDADCLAYGEEDFSRARGELRLAASVTAYSGDATWEGFPFRVAGTLTSGVHRGTLEVREAALSSLHRRLPELAKRRVSGRLSGSFSFSGPTKGLVLSGKISCPILSYGDIALSGISASVEGNEKALALSPLSGRYSGSLFSADLRVENPLGARRAFSGTLRYDGKVPDGVLSRLPSGSRMDPVALSAAFSGPEDSLRCEYRLSIPNASLRRGNRDILLSRLLLSGTALPLQRRSDRLQFSFRVAGGSVQGQGRAALPSEGPLFLDTRGSFSGIDTRALRPLVSADIPEGRLSGSFTLRGTTQAPEWTLQAALPRLSLAGFDLTSCNVDLASSAKGPALRRFTAALLGGGIAVTGGLSADPKGGTLLDLACRLSGIDLARLAAGRIPGVALRGHATGDLALSGNASDPKFRFTGSLDRFALADLYFPSARITLEGDDDRIQAPAIVASVGGSAVNASFSAQRGAKGWSARFGASGKDLPLRDFALYTRAMKGKLEGRVSFDLSGQVSADGEINGKGTARFPSLSYAGLRATDLVAPFFLNSGYAFVEDAHGKAFGGSLFAQFGRDLSSSHYGGRIEIKGADFASAFASLFPGQKGKITGKADFSLFLAGDSRRSSLNDGGGRLTLTDGEISGFTSAAAIAAVTGNKPLQFRSVALNYTIDGKTLYLLPGSRIAAPPGHPAYRYLMTDGGIGIESKKLDLSCYGNINIRALNAFAGAIQGLIGSAFDTQSLLRNFLGGLVGGYARNDFRDVSFQVKGTFEDPSLANLKIERPLRVSDPIPREPSDPKNKPADEIKIKIEVPVGPGGTSPDTSHISDQILEQAIKQILIRGTNDSDASDPYP